MCCVSLSKTFSEFDQSSPSCIDHFGLGHLGCTERKPCGSGVLVLRFFAWVTAHGWHDFRGLGFFVSDRRDWVRPAGFRQSQKYLQRHCAAYPCTERWDPWVRIWNPRVTTSHASLMRAVLIPCFYLLYFFVHPHLNKGCCCWKKAENKCLLRKVSWKYFDSKFKDHVVTLKSMGHRTHIALRIVTSVNIARLIINCHL